MNYYVFKSRGQIIFSKYTNGKNTLRVYREDYPKYKIPVLWYVTKVSFTEIIGFAKKNNCNISLCLVLSKYNKEDLRETRLSFKSSVININEFISQQRKIQKKLFQNKTKNFANQKYRTITKQANII